MEPSLVGMQIGAATLENRMEIPQKIKNRLHRDPAMPLLKIYLQKLKSGFQRNNCTLMSITALFTIVKKEPTCPPAYK